MDLSVNIGGVMVAKADLAGWRELVRSMDLAVIAARNALVEARVVLGHVLRHLEGALTPQAYDDFVRSTGLHHRRVSEAVRVAEHFATAEGRVDWEKFRQEAGEKAKPSVRAMVAVIAAKEARAREAARPRRPDAQLEALGEAAIAAAAAAKARQAEAEAMAALEVLAAPTAAPEGAPAGAVVVEEVGEVGEVGGTVAGTRASERPKGAAGRQLDMGPLFEEAWAAMQRAQDVFARIGVAGVEAAFVVLRERLAAAAA